MISTLFLNKTQILTYNTHKCYAKINLPPYNFIIFVKKNINFFTKFSFLQNFSSLQKFHFILDKNSFLILEHYMRDKLKLTFLCRMDCSLI